MKNAFKNVNISNKIQQETNQPQTISIHNSGRYHVIKSRKGSSHPIVDESIKSYDPQNSASCGRPSPSNPSTWAVQPTTLPPPTYVNPSQHVQNPYLVPHYPSNYVYQTVPAVPAMTTVDPYSTPLETYYTPTSYIPQHIPGMEPQIERTIIQVAPAYGIADPSQPLVFAQPIMDPYSHETNNIPFFLPNHVAAPPRFTLLQRPIQTQPFPHPSSPEEIQYQPFQQYQDYQDYGDWQAHESPKRVDNPSPKSKERSGSPEPTPGGMIDPSQRNSKNRSRREKSYYLEDQIEEENTNYVNKNDANEKDEQKHHRNKGKSQPKIEGRQEDVNVGRQPPVQNLTPKKSDYYETTEAVDPSPKKYNRKRNEQPERPNTTIVVYPRYPPYIDEFYEDEQQPEPIKETSAGTQRNKTKRKFRQKNPNEYCPTKTPQYVMNLHSV
eukprot:NODE_2593_length_1541_cov_40.267983_g2235_i0.p1 GENE.NODE_2593_length_1541_cov_40.267983_g2235_i0~~NODE_2593_length_1541_cov_40.267983_g2235_i0.p1  ORF type:complete len:438 (+),score=103.27 NODE_2593_length_1541_cov_40.267983_g2235_i0:67-1380(+)